MKNFFILIVLLAGIPMLHGQNIPVVSKAASLESKPLSRSFELPFYEDWSSGSLETNNWTTECENWAINNHEGNESPSAEFTWDPLMQNGYSCSLTSDTLDGNLIEVGNIMLSFDVKLDDRNSTGEEKLTVEVSDSSGWVQVAEFTNNGSFDWTNSEVNITDIVPGKKFQVRFNANGQNSFNIISWFVDNISVYRTCDPPFDLDGELIWQSNDELAVELTWKPPANTDIPDSTWLHWDSGGNYWGIGLTSSNADFSVAIRYDPGQLSDYDGDTIGQEKIYLYDSGFSQVVAKIWTGENASTLIYADTLENPVGYAWNTVNIDSLIIINADNEYWVGYTILGQPEGFLPAGVDAGPAVAGYGDLVSTDGVTWLKLSDMGLNYNFNIRFTVYAHDQSALHCVGFDLFRQKINSNDYEFYDFIPFISGLDEYTYYDEDLQDYLHTVCYKVNAIWAFNNDTCTSSYARAKNMPIDNYVCVILDEGIDENIGSHITVYPNPVSSSLKIKSEENIIELMVYNNMGQPVIRVGGLNTKQHELDVGKLPPGIYFIRIETKNHFAVRKFLKLR